jgi:replicative DNA helicase
MLSQGAKLLGDETYKAIRNAYVEAEKLPVTYQQNSTNIRVVKRLVLEFIESCENKAKIEKILIQPVVIIDYIGMAMFDGSGLRTYGIGDFMNGCKQLANQTGAAFCIFAQINRGADSKDMPERSDFSDSQSIEMASDNLLLLHRPEYNGIPVITDPSTGLEMGSEGKMLIRILKGRDFGTGDVLINCDIKHYRFWDLDHDRWSYPYWTDYNKKEFWMQQFGFVC